MLILAIQECTVLIRALLGRKIYQVKNAEGWLKHTGYTRHRDETNWYSSFRKAKLLADRLGGEVWVSGGDRIYRSERA